MIIGIQRCKTETCFSCSKIAKNPKRCTRCFNKLPFPIYYCEECIKLHSGTWKCEDCEKEICDADKWIFTNTGNGEEWIKKYKNIKKCMNCETKVLFG